MNLKYYNNGKITIIQFFDCLLQSRSNSHRHRCHARIFMKINLNMNIRLNKIPVMNEI